MSYVRQPAWTGAYLPFGAGDMVVAPGYWPGGGNVGLSGICDSLLYATTPLGLLFCPGTIGTSAGTDATSIGTQISSGGSAPSVLGSIVTGDNYNLDGSSAAPSATPNYWALGLALASIVVIGGLFKR